MLHLNDYIERVQEMVDMDNHVRVLNRAIGDGWDGFFENERIHLNKESFNLRIRPYGSSDSDVFEQIFLDEEYGSFAELIGRNQSEEIVLIDGGANIGFFPIYMRDRVRIKDTGIIEPNKENFDLAAENLRENGVGEANLFRNALWDENIHLYIKSDFRDGREWAYIAGMVKLESSEQIQGVSLEGVLQAMDLSKEGVVALKLDIEGAEFKVIPQIASSGLLRRRIKFICLEIHEEFGKRYDIMRELEKDFSLEQQGENIFGMNKHLSA
jgi:FkbM family methyltransferase